MPSGLRGFLVDLTHSCSNPGLTNNFTLYFSFFVIYPANFKKMYKYAKFEQNILCGSNSMGIFNERPGPAKIILGNCLSPLCIPVAG